MKVLAMKAAAGKAGPALGCLLIIGIASMPASGQQAIQADGEWPRDAAPQCAITNFDQKLNAYTVINAVSGAVNQQCFFTVLPREPGNMGSVLPLLAEYPSPRFPEGRYIITLSGGGGGGGAGSSRDGGGGGGAGAQPSQQMQYLPPGIYRMTIGSGGDGGIACQPATAGGLGINGNPTSISEAYTGSLVAGFPRAEYWAGSNRLSYAVAALGAPGQFAQSVSGGSGAPGLGGQSPGGHGGRTGSVNAAKAQDGGTLGEVAYPGLPGRGGDGFLPSDASTLVAGGGGGGAGYGHGGDGQSGVPRSFPAMAGELGAGGGGGAGGNGQCGAGGPGGQGFIAIRPA